jgi:nucleotide-binding universal stress UspA family protein
MDALQRILVATDLSEASEAIYRVADDLARRSGAQMTIAHIADLLDYEEIRRETPIGLDDYMAKLRLGIRTAFERAVGERAAARPIRVEVVMKAHSVPRELLELARREEADLVVLGTHGRTGLARTVLGSVAEEVLRHAEVPVLVVPVSAARVRAEARVEAGARVAAARPV